MRLTVLILIVAVVGSPERERNVPSEEKTIDGVVRTAGGSEPIPNATVYTEASDTTLTDSAGRFTLRVSRLSSLLGVRKEGFLAFEYPMLRLTTDTLRAEIELRTDPPGRESYGTARHLFHLCIVVDAPDRLVVRNHCGTNSLAWSEYTRRIIKHNPWNPYFGPAGDKGGVQIMTRVIATGAKQ